MKIEVIKNNESLLAQVVELGTRNSKTLGHFPEGAYYEHAHRGFLICAHNEGHLLGYVLFSITQSKNYIRIIQLCTSDDARKQGVAKELLDGLKSKFRNSFKGIALSCRSDYQAASALWESYGFKAMDKVRSRSKKENYLFKWWFDFGNHDLFSLFQASSTKLKAVLDANIIIKLRNRSTNDKDGAYFLLEDWLVDVVDYYYAPEIFNEIKRDKDDNRAKQTRSFLTNFHEAKFDPDSRDKIYKQIDNLIPGSSINDLSDKRQLSECIASDIIYFITTDKKILDANTEINDLFGIEVLRPIDLILTIDENYNKSNYLSTRIAGVNYEQINLRPNEIDQLVDKILAKDQSEKKHELRSTFTSSAADIKNSRTKVIRDRENRILGVWICELKKDKLNIPVLRTTKSKLSNTLFKQLVSETINFAIQSGKHLIIISDKYVDTTDQETLESMGFILQHHSWVKFAANKIIDSRKLFEIPMVNTLIDQKKVMGKLLHPNFNEFRFKLERKLWPLKFIDIDIPTYIVPIKPYWASQLFDHYSANDSVFGAEASLVWNRENIYYRNIKPVSEKPNGRLLWYSSTSKDKAAIRTNAIVACSYLDEVHTGEAKELFGRFRHYGVYKWSNIIKLAKNDAHNRIKALKFSDTEVFKNTISFEQVNKVLIKYGRKKNTFTAPLEISNELFLEIYKLGFDK